MPFVRIYVKDGVSVAQRRAYGDAIHAAMQETINVPAEDHFQVLSSHTDDLIYDPSYLGIERGEGIVLVLITLSFGRSVAQKQALFAAIADKLAAAGARREDAVVILTEVARENWSFGNGIAQYVVAPPPHLAGPA